MVREKLSYYGHILSTTLEAHKLDVIADTYNVNCTGGTSKKNSAIQILLKNHFSEFAAFLLRINQKYLYIQ